jgi:hypothetical protein
MTGFNRKLQEARSGLYGGCGKVLIPCVSRYCHHVRLMSRYIQQVYNKWIPWAWVPVGKQPLLQYCTISGRTVVA